MFAVFRVYPHSCVSLPLIFCKAAEVVVPGRYKRAIFLASLAFADIHDIHEKDDHEHFQGTAAIICLLSSFA